MSDANYILRFRRLQLSVRYDNVLSPSDIAKLIHALPAKGYSITGKSSALPEGSSHSFSGELARKGDISLRLDDERYVVALERAKRNSQYQA